MPVFTLGPSDFALLCEVIQAVARTSRLAPEDADDFRQSVHLRLLERNYAPLARFRGESSFRTFLTVVVTRMLLDWRNSRFGKWRASSCARRLGPAAVDLDRLISRDGWRIDEAVAIVSPRHPSMTPEALQDVAGKLPQRAAIQTFAADDVDDLRVGTFDDPIERAEEDGAQRISRRTLRRAYRRLPADERRLLALRFGRRMSVAAIATLLGQRAKPLYRRIERILARLRRTMEEMQPAHAQELPDELTRTKRTRAA